MCRSDGASGERNPVDLVLEDASEIPMLFGRDPKMAIRPKREGSQFLDRRVSIGYRISNGKFGRVKDSDVTAKTMEDSRGFECHEF